MMYPKALMGAWLAMIVQAGVLGTAAAGAENPFRRVANTTLRMPAELVTAGFGFEDAFPGLTFERPVTFRTPPGETQRLFVVEQTGRIQVITNLAAPTKTLFLDLTDRVALPIGAEEGLLGMAFHPGYATNRYFYVFYTRFDRSPFLEGMHDRLARFETSPDDPNVALPDSELPLFTQPDVDAYHNSGCLQFGPDGYLYVSLGDGGAMNDLYGNGQLIDRDFFSGILRIDVDGRPGNLPPNPHLALPANANYWVPADNPFIGTSYFNGIEVDPNLVRTEFHAVGLRNPWQFSFDPVTGNLYSNDVGQELREEINLILPGSNHGWSQFEGTLRRGSVPLNQLSFPVAPLVEYDRSRGNAIGGSLFYRGDRYPGLNGSYLFSDFSSGAIGAMRIGGTPLESTAGLLSRALVSARETLRTWTPELEAAEERWEAGFTDAWVVLQATGLSSGSWTELRILPDGSILARGGNPTVDEYVFRSVVTNVAAIRALRLDALAHPDLPGGGPGRVQIPTGDGNFVITNVRFGVRAAGSGQPFEPIPLLDPRASYEQAKQPVADLLDDNGITGWAIHPEMGRDHYAMFTLGKVVEVTAPIEIEFRIEQALGAGFNLGRFQISVASDLAAVAQNPPRFVRQVLAIPRAERNERQVEVVRSYFRTIAPELQEARDRVRGLESSVSALIETDRPPTDWIAAEPGIAALGLDPSTGDVIGANWISGSIVRLVYHDASEVQLLPERLSETGAFADLSILTPQPGIYPYHVNASFWSDNAFKRRWFSVPDPSLQFEFHLDEPWLAPDGAVWIKHFEMERFEGDPRSRRRLETRFLVRNEGGVYGVTYRWRDDGTDAELVPPGGIRELITVETGAGPREQLWIYPSRSECLQCHNAVAGHVLGFKTAQLNCPGPGEASGNQIALLADAGFVRGTPSPEQILPAHADVHDGNASVAHRIRSFLDVNCAYCHQPGGFGRGNWDGRHQITLDAMNLIDAAPIDDMGDPLNRLVVPGEKERSILWRRISQGGAYHMPPLAIQTLNTAAADLMAYWITTELPAALSGANVPPTVDLVFPSMESRVPAGLGVLLGARASDSDGRIQSLTFWIDDQPLPVLSASPFQSWWQPGAPGVYQVAAEVADDKGAVVRTPTVALRVEAEPTQGVAHLLVPKVLGEGRLSFEVPESSHVIAIEGSDDLIRWVELDWFGGAGGTLVVSDEGARRGGARFYRARLHFPP